MEDTARLILFTLVWTAIWVAPLPRLARWAELVAGLVPFAAFGLRVFAGFFAGVPNEDHVRLVVSPLLSWINGGAGFPPFGWVLDATVALGLAWLASAFDIPRQSRIATVWIIPVVAALACSSLWATGLPIERLLSRDVPAVMLACAAGTILGAGISWTPSPIPANLRWRAAIVAILTVPAVVAGGKLVGLAGNRTLEFKDPTAHAEILAIRQAAAALGSERLGGGSPAGSPAVDAGALGRAPCGTGEVRETAS